MGAVKNFYHDEICGGSVEQLREVADAAREFLQTGSRVTMIGGRLVHEIIERDDKSDPHFRLCKAVEILDGQKASTAGALA